MKLLYTVMMDQSDVTDWVTSLKITQPPKGYWLEFSLTFAGWSSITEGSSWDIFASYDPATPRQEILIRDGVLAPDRERYPSVAANGTPTLTVKGYSRVWLAHRKHSRETITLVPGSGIEYEDVDGKKIVRNNSAQLALARYNGPVGRVRVKTKMNTVKDAVRWLGNQAGVNVDYRLPNYPLQPTVIDPTKSYWAAMMDLVNPWSPEIYYRAQTNMLSIIDPLAPRFQIGSTMNIEADKIKSVRGIPVRRKRVGRVIVSVPNGS